MLNFSQFLLESLKNRTTSYWSKIEPVLREIMQEHLEDMSHKVQEFGYEVEKRTIKTKNYDRLGFGVSFRHNDKHYSIFNDMKENMFNLHLKKNLDDPNGQFISTHYQLEGLLVEVKELDKQLFLLADIEDLEGNSRSEKIVLDYDYESDDLRSYVKYLYKKIVKMWQEEDEMFTLVFFHNNKLYKLMGNNRNYDVQDEDNDSIILRL